MKRVTLSAIMLLSIIVCTSFTKDTNTNKPLEKVRFYAYGYTWGNRDLNGRSENGSDGVAYVSNVTSFTVDRYSSTPRERLRAKGSAEIKASGEFMDSFRAHYSNDIYSTYYINGVHVTEVFETRDEALKARRNTIADYNSDDVIVRYFNNFEVYD